MVKTVRLMTSEVAKRTGYLMAPTKEVLECFEELLWEHIVKGNTVRVGPIEAGLRVYPRQEGDNPKTGEHYVSPEHTVPYARIRHKFKQDYKEQRD